MVPGAIMFHLSLIKKIVLLNKLSNHIELVEQHFDQIDIVEGRFGAGLRYGDHDASAISLFRRQSRRDEAILVDLSYDRLVAVVNFGAELFQELFTHVQLGEFF